MVVVTVQVTAVVLQLLSFSKAVVLGGCECTGNNCWVAVSVILWGWWWGWLYVQLTAVVLQFLSFREGSGGGCCKCTCDSWCVAVSVIPLWGWLWMYRQQLLCCSFCQFIRQWCGGACESTDDSCCVAVSVSSSGSGVEVHVNVQMTAVVLQLLLFHHAVVWRCMWMYRWQLLCCSFCHFIRQWCGGACECTDDSCCVAVSVSSWRSWCTRTRRKPSWGVCLEPTTSCTATWSCTCPLLPSRLRSALLDVILVQRLLLSCNVVLVCCLKWPFWPYYSGIGRCWENPDTTHLKVAVTLVKQVSLNCDVVLAGCLEWPFLPYYSGIGRCWENPDTTHLKVAVTLVQRVSLNCNVILVSYLEWPFSIKFNSKTLIIPQGAILLQLLISDLTTVGLAGTEKTQTQHA